MSERRIPEADRLSIRRAWLGGYSAQSLAEIFNTTAGEVQGLMNEMDALLSVPVAQQPSAAKQQYHREAPREVGDQTPGHLLSEDLISGLYAGRRYGSEDLTDNTEGRVFRPAGSMCGASSLVGVMGA